MFFNNQNEIRKSCLSGTVRVPQPMREGQNSQLFIFDSGMLVLHEDMVLDQIVLLKTFSFAQNQVKSNLELQARFIPLELSFGCYCLENDQREVTLGRVCPNVGKIDMQLRFHKFFVTVLRNQQILLEDRPCFITILVK